MRCRVKRVVTLGWMMLVLTCAVAYGSAPTPIPSFTISANNTTMPTTGTATIPFTITSVNGYTGSLTVRCVPPNPPSGVREPQCGGGPPSSIVLSANTSQTSNFTLYPYIYVGATLTGTLKHLETFEGVTLAFAGLLGLGLPLRRGKSIQRTSGRLLVAIGILAGLSGLNACGGVLTLTPGTYTYTLSATSQDNASSSVNTTLQVAVPPGVDVQESITPF